MILISNQLITYLIQVQLVDDIAATTIKNTVIGEEIRTDSKLGAKMIMAK